MESQSFSPTAVGTHADVQAGTNIEKIFGGYFSNPDIALAFCELGIKPIAPELSEKVDYADFGSGGGYLTQHVSSYLQERNHTLDTVCIDANKHALERASERGFKTILQNLEHLVLHNVDLVTMRAVNHYNTLPGQLAILTNANKILKKKGYLVSQINVGTDANCRLRSAIANLPSLGRVTHDNQLHWVSTHEYVNLLKRAGFESNELVGYAPGNKWSPEDQWERANAKKLAEAEDEGNTHEVEQLQEMRTVFLNEARAIINGYLLQYSDRALGLTQENDTYYIEYSCPVIISHK